MAILGMILFIENYRIITWVCQLLKKKYSLNVKNYVLFGGLEDILSDCSEGLLQRGQGGTGYIRVFPEKKKKKKKSS